MFDCLINLFRAPKAGQSISFLILTSFYTLITPFYLKTKLVMDRINSKKISRATGATITTLYFVSKSSKRASLGSVFWIKERLAYIIYV